MQNQSRRVIHNIVIVAALLLLCVVLRPDGLAANDGFSYYGSVWLTLIPFAAALLIYEYSLWNTSKMLGHRRKYRVLAIGLKAMAILTIGVLITPISIMENFHSLIGLILFLVQLGVSIRLLMWGFHWLDAGLVGVEALGLITGLYFAQYDHGLLLQSQLVFQIAFVTLLVRSLALLRNKPVATVHVLGDRDKASALLTQAARSSEDFFKLWPADKHYFWSTKGNAFVAYRVVGRIAFAIADPVARTPALRQAMLEKFVDHCHAQKWRVCFVMVADDARPHYEQAGLKTVKVGASAIIDLQTFASETTSSKWWRWQRNAGERLDYSYECKPPPHSRAVLAEVRQVSDAWLKHGHHHEQGFALGYFDTTYLQQCTLHLLRDHKGNLVAFANQVPVFNNLPMATTDLMRFVPDAPHAMPYLLLQLLRKLRDDGTVTHFDLGFVPLAQMHGVAASITRTLGAHRFSAAGLEQFKNKFDPTWQANYFACDGDLTDLALIALHLQKAVSIDKRTLASLHPNARRGRS